MEKEYNPDDSIIRLNEYEYHFVKEYYPDVDPDHLLLPAFGLSSVTNMDLLESSLKYDIENQVLDRYPDPLHDYVAEEREKQLMELEGSDAVVTCRIDNAAGLGVIRIGNRNWKARRTMMPLSSSISRPALTM